MTDFSREAAERCARQYVEANPNRVLGILPLGSTLPIADTAIILRHGGASTHRWRAIKACRDVPTAEAEFMRRNASIRQGGLAIWFAGAIVRIATAPTLRSRW